MKATSSLDAGHVSARLANLPVPHPSGRDISLPRQMPSSQQNLASEASQAGPRVVSIFGEREEPTLISSGDHEHSLLRQMYTSQHARNNTTDSSQPGPVYTVSLFGERVEPARVSDRSRDVSLLCQVTASQQRHRSATSTSQRGLRDIDVNIRRPPSNVDNRVARCRVEISSADQSAATAAAARLDRRQLPSTSSGDRGEVRRRGGDGEAAQIVASRAPVTPAAPTDPPRIRSSPGSRSRPRAFTANVSRHAPPAGHSAIISQIGTRAVFQRL